MESSHSSEVTAAATTSTPAPTGAAWRPRSPILVGAGNFFFKYRDFISPAVFLALVLIFRPRLPMGDERPNWVTNVIGILFVLAGQVLRAAVIGFEYIKRGGKDKQVYADNLVTGGFFAHARNPLYVGNFLTIVGLFIIHNNPWVYLIGIPFYAFLYLSIVSAEETFLHNKFGPQYEDYCRRVNRFVPSFTGLGTSVRDMKFDWARLVRKEYGTTFSWYSAVLGLIAWEEYLHFGYESRRVELHVLGALWVLGAIAWGLSRYLKKRGTLGTG